LLADERAYFPESTEHPSFLEDKLLEIIHFEIQRLPHQTMAVYYNFIMLSHCSASGLTATSGKCLSAACN